MPTQDSVLDRQFASIGARARLAQSPTAAIDVRRDRRGEYFELRLPGEASVAVLDADRRSRHLLVLVDINGDKSRYLCGHDERHWFVAAIPEIERGVVGVTAARRALMPAAVRAAASSLRHRERSRRRNRAFIRQGEWFFVPSPDIAPTWWTILHDEPLSRGRGKFHMMEFAFRRGGVRVYVDRSHPTGVTQAEFDELPEDVQKGSWRRMVRGAEVYAKGRITHPDHATIVLRGWHRVFMNTESQARAMRHVAFLD
jgi:hypothetical protein